MFLVKLILGPNNTLIVFWMKHQIHTSLKKCLKCFLKIYLNFVLRIDFKNMFICNLGLNWSKPQLIWFGMFLYLETAYVSLTSLIQAWAELGYHCTQLSSTCLHPKGKRNKWNIILPIRIQNFKNCLFFSWNCLVQLIN